jgi:hypothetical protein
VDVDSLKRPAFDVDQLTGTIAKAGLLMLGAFYDVESPGGYGRILLVQNPGI